MILALFLLACSGGTDANNADDTSAADADTDTDADTDADSDSDSDTDADCSAVTAGDDWAWTGACPGMTTPVSVAVDGCILTLDYGSGGMTMGMPYAGTVSGTTVTFEDGDSVTGCTGTVESADKIEGSCDGGCTYKLKR